MSHYDKAYFNWQKKMGEFGGKENLFKFEKFIKPDDRVMEFGCGGGYLLSNFKCREKIGVEINPHARKNAELIGIRTVEDAGGIEDEWADVIVSDNALEHAFSPLDVLKKLNRKLRAGGEIVFVVPQEYDIKYVENDINQHLFSWSPMCIGNLFALAGYKVKKVEIIRSLWPPCSYAIRRLTGEHVFRAICWFYGSVFGKWRQIRIVAEKP